MEKDTPNQDTLDKTTPKLTKGYTKTPRGKNQKHIQTELNKSCTKTLIATKHKKKT